MSPELRAAMGQAAVAAAKAAAYEGAGTIEFIADGSAGLKAGAFWFMEMNTRLQVEHPVTEAITGLDLVEWQFRIAVGEKLPLTQDQVPLQGHAVEARLYAEDPERGFLPSTGKLLALVLPSGDGLRVDAGVEKGSDITPYYDPLIAKVIAQGANRTEALDRLGAALERTVVAGPRSNAGFLAALCRAAEFRSGQFDTGFIDRNLVALGATPQVLDKAAAALGAKNLLERERFRIAAAAEPDVAPSPWDAADGFQLAGQRRLMLPIVVEGENQVAEVAYAEGGPAISVHGVPPAGDATVIDAADAVYVLRQGHQTKVALRDLSIEEAGDHGKGGLVRAPMHGKVLSILVEKGAKVVRGQRLAIIEAMKMEHTLTAPIDGVVADITATANAQVPEGARLMLIEPAAETQA
jgi:3-methylcrotonyl-CoA carboxylase alpha subunit